MDLYNPSAVPEARPMDPSAALIVFLPRNRGDAHGAGLPSRATCATLTRMVKKFPAKSAMKPAAKAKNALLAKPAPKKTGKKW
jgi:hypothetical protein